MTRFLITDPGTAAHSAKNAHAAPGLPNNPRNDSKGRNPMVSASSLVLFDELGLRLLHDRASQCQYAYGYLSSAVQGVLDGKSDLARLRTILDALNAEMGGEVR